MARFRKTTWYQQAQAPTTQPTQADPVEVWWDTQHEDGALPYNESDHTRHNYRKNWCVLRERDVQPLYNDFVERPLHKYGGLRKFLRRAPSKFYVAKNSMLKKQPHGDDIDAVVEGYADAATGREMSSRVFTNCTRWSAISR